MYKTIENRTKMVVSFRLNSGRTLYIGPKAISEEIHVTEVKSNRKVGKLENRGVIVLNPAPKKQQAKGPKKESPGSITGKEKSGSPGQSKKQTKSNTEGGK